MDSGAEKVGKTDLEKGLTLPHRPAQFSDSLPLPSPTPLTPRTTALVFSNSGKALLVSSSGKSLSGSGSGKSLLVSPSGKSLLGSHSGKGEKTKYVKQVTGRHNDTELHLAAKRGDVGTVRQIFAEIDAAMLGTTSGADSDDSEVEEMKLAMVNEVNELGETALLVAAREGHLDVVEELLKHTTREGLSIKNRFGFDPFHIAANQGHAAIVKLLLEHDPGLSKTVGQSNATPLISAATRGHLDVVNQLLSADPTLIESTKLNGKNALHFAVRQGHVDIVKQLLEKNPQLSRRTDKKGQTALHMAVKGVSRAVVRSILQADAGIVTLPDKFGNTALHIATRKKRSQIVNELLRIPDTDVNALTREKKTALDIAEGLPFSEETSEIKETLYRYGGLRAKELNHQSKDELREKVKEIRKDVHAQLEQTRKTHRNVDGIALELKKLHKEGINNATNSVTVVAVLFATVAFAALFTVPGGDTDTGMAVMVDSVSFQIFFICNAIALFTSLCVVVVQITVVRREVKTERRFVEIINKLMWLASVCTTLAFVSSSYIVVGRRNQWAAILVTVTGGVTMTGVLGAMTYYVVKSYKIRKEKRKEKLLRSELSDSSDTDVDVNTIYAI